jgi:hypothetical protein
LQSGRHRDRRRDLPRGLVLLIAHLTPSPSSLPLCLLLSVPSPYCPLLQVRYSGFRAIKAGLQADTYIEAMDITKNKQGYEEALQSPLLSPRLDQQVDSRPPPPPPPLVTSLCALVA